jgi:DNA-binding FrmR family transcriptional regulator
MFETAETEHDKAKAKKQLHKAQEHLQGIAAMFETAETDHDKAKAKKQLQKAQEHLQGIAAMFETAETDHDKALGTEKCKLWKKSKDHNPFNKTNKGRKLKVDSKIRKQLDQYCSSKEAFCATKNNILSRKICK